MEPQHYNKSIETVSRTVPALSAEIFVIPLENETFLVYAPLRHSAFIGNARIVNFLAELKKGTYNAGIDEDGSLTAFLSTLKMINAGEEELPLATYTGMPLPTEVTLFLTTACNLRCTYCYASAGDNKARFMPIEVAKRGIDFIIKNAIKKNHNQIDICYHGGGEPIMNERVMHESLSYANHCAEKQGLEVIASTATNGVLNDKQIDWIITHLQGASLSFDGLPEVHDKHRITPSGKGSSEQVMHTLKRFDEADFFYGIRVTVTADQIDKMPDSVEYICSHSKPIQIQVEPAYQIGRWTDAPSAETEAFIAGFREARIRAKKFGQHIMFSGARAGLLTNHFCGISQDSFALTADGSVSSCYEVFSEDNPLGNIFIYGKPDKWNDGYTFDMKRLDFLRKQAVEYRDYCRGCFAKWSCAGDCYHKAVAVNKTTKFMGSDRCSIIRELTKDQILSKIVESGGMYWVEQ